MTVTVRIPTTLRPLSGGVSTVQVEGATLADVLKGLNDAHPGFSERLFDATGNLHKFVNVFVSDDDVLGAFGDTATTGKPVGDDLREGKPTPLMAIATEHANAAQLQVLQLVGHARLTDSQVTDVQRVIRETGALDQLEAEISNKTDEAIAAIQQAPITDVARDELIALAAYVSWRSV